MLLQLSSYEFGLETECGPKIATAVKAHATEIAKLPPAARKILTLVAVGKGKSLAERRAKMSAKQVRFLRANQLVPFEKREPALFESKAAAAYVQQIAKLCVDKIDEDFEDEDNWSDLRRDGDGGVACLGILLVLDPCKVPASKIDRWRRNAKKGLEVLEEEPDDELDFYRGYYANLDAVLGLLAKRFAN